MTEQYDDAEARVREPLRIPHFARFWTSETFGVFGVSVAAVAVDVLVVQVLHVSEAEVGMIRAVDPADQRHQPPGGRGDRRHRQRCGAAA